MSQFFYFYDNDKKRGPYSADQMKEYARTGIIKVNTIVDVNGTNYRADKLKGLADILLSEEKPKRSVENAAKAKEDDGEQTYQAEEPRIRYSGTVAKDPNSFSGLMDKHPIAVFFGNFNGLIVALLGMASIAALGWFIWKEWQLDMSAKAVMSIRIIATVLGAAIIIKILSFEKKFVDNWVERIKASKK